MNILDKMPKRLIELMLNQGLAFKIGRSEYGIYLDLNTGMKSHLHLYYEGESYTNAGTYIARMRYDEEQVVNDLSDVLYCIKSCKHGRDFMHQGWEVPLNEGFGEFSDEPLDFL